MVGRVYLICKGCGQRPPTRPELTLCRPCFEIHWREIEENKPKQTPQNRSSFPSTPRDPEGVTELYRHFDADDNLLYVGISISAFARLSSHRSQSAWFNQIVKITIERYPTRKEAEAAEIEAIKTEKTKHNKGWVNFRWN